MVSAWCSLDSCEATTLHINYLLFDGSFIISTFFAVCKTVSDVYLHEHFIIREMFGCPFCNTVHVVVERCVFGSDCDLLSLIGRMVKFLMLKV